MKQGDTHMSRGYTRALARTAPVAPATARPQGGMGASFDCPAIAACVFLNLGAYFLFYKPGRHFEMSCCCRGYVSLAILFLRISDMKSSKLGMAGRDESGGLVESGKSMASGNVVAI